MSASQTDPDGVSNVCGIAGVVATGGRRANRRTLERMCEAMVHRGPDSEGFHVEEGVALAVRRLAIIDVKRGHQPIYNEDKSVCMVMNGEIYNFRELREQLQTRGHKFTTDSDTEVIIHLYEQRGKELVNELRGMFAFALWDRKKGQLLLARDRVGKKPLYYWQHGPRISFASELAALLEDEEIPRRVDAHAIDAYLAFLYVPHPLCAIEGVRKLPPASTLVWQNGESRLERYWSLAYEPKSSGSPSELQEDVHDKLREAVRLRLISERPLGAFLSGGVDSTAVVATMAELSSGPIKTFSIGFASARFNELSYARRVAEIFCTDHTEHVVDPDALAILPKLITRYGDPFGDSSAIPSYYVAELASRQLVVALNGDGGDESFGGYNRYVANLIAERLSRLPAPMRRALTDLALRFPEPVSPSSMAARLRRLAAGLALSPGNRYAQQMTYLPERVREDLYQPGFKALLRDATTSDALQACWRSSGATSLLDRMLDVDVQTYLPGDLLVKMDIATMANSVEARSPFLDHVLMETAARLPASFKVKGRTTKVGLKSILRGVVPGDLIDRPKWGFSVPLAEWLRGPLNRVVREVLLDPRAARRGVMRVEPVRRAIEEHTGGKADRSTQIWLLFVLELWYRRFIDREPEGALL